MRNIETLRKVMLGLAVAGIAVVGTLIGCGGGGGGGKKAAVASVTVTAGQTIAVGQTKRLSAAAFDANGNSVSVSASKFQWRVATGGSFLSFGADGQATGVAEGSPTVIARVNGIDSPAQTVTVAGGCSSATYTPNYFDAILTPGIPNVSGNFRFWSTSPLSVFFHTGGSYRADLEAAFRTGMTQWQAATSNGIPFVNGADASADIEVEFVPASSLPSGAIGITFATFNADTRQMSHARIQIASDLGTANETLTTCSHELGHALGIGGHSPNDTDLMYFAENGTTTTTARDLNTLRTVYCNFFPKTAARSAGRMVTEAIR